MFTVFNAIDGLNGMNFDVLRWIEYDEKTRFNLDEESKIDDLQKWIYKVNWEKTLMYEARLVSKIFDENYNVCGAKERWVTEAMWEILLRETIYYQHPRRLEIFELILKRFRKFTSQVKNGKYTRQKKQFLELIGDIILHEIVESAFTIIEFTNIKTKKFARMHGYAEDMIDRTDFIIIQMRKIWEQDELMFLEAMENTKKLKMKL
jgi:hypothetical protein